jgi:hypothetical protein
MGARNYLKTALLLAGLSGLLLLVGQLLAAAVGSPSRRSWPSP